MMKTYYNRYTININGMEYKDCSEVFLAREDEIQKLREIKVNWDNLNEVYCKYGLVLPFNIWNFKKGRVVSFFHSSLFDRRTWDIKERKNPNFTFTIKVEAVEDENVPLKYIYDYPEAEKAIEYLKEKGLDKIKPA